MDQNNFELVKKLVESGKDVNAHYGSHLYTPLQVAVLRKNEEIVKYLLEHGIQFREFNSKGVRRRCESKEP